MARVAKKKKFEIPEQYKNWSTEIIEKVKPINLNDILEKTILVKDSLINNTEKDVAKHLENLGLCINIKCKVKSSLIKKHEVWVKQRVNYIENLITEYNNLDDNAQVKNEILYKKLVREHIEILLEKEMVS